MSRLANVGCRWLDKCIIQQCGEIRLLSIQYFLDRVNLSLTVAVQSLFFQVLAPVVIVDA